MLSFYKFFGRSKKKDHCITSKACFVAFHLCQRLEPQFSSCLLSLCWEDTCLWDSALQSPCFEDWRTPKCPLHSPFLLFYDTSILPVAVAVLPCFLFLPLLCSRSSCAMQRAGCLLPAWPYLCVCLQNSCLSVSRATVKFSSGQCIAACFS